MWTKIPASCAGRDSGLGWALPPFIGFSCSVKRKRVFAFPVASSKVRSPTSFFSLGIAAFAASRRSAALSDFLIYVSSSGVFNSSSVNCKREDFSFTVASRCAFCAAFLLAFRVWAAPTRSMTRSAVAVSCLWGSSGARGSGEASGETGGSSATFCAAASFAACGSGCSCAAGFKPCRFFCGISGSGCSCGLEKSASRSRRLTRSAVSLVSLTSISPSRVIFCVILSRGLYCFMAAHLQSAPLQGRNTQYSVQYRYSGGQGFLRLPPLCRCLKRGL